MKRFALTTFSLLLIFVLALSGVAQRNIKKPAPAAVIPPIPQAAYDQISAEDLLNHTKALSSDEFEGRAPGTPGEEKTVDYLQRKSEKFGLQPGNPDGTYIQKVPLVGITTPQTARLKIHSGSTSYHLNGGDEFIARTVRVVDSTSFDGDMVFVGYGVVAPEYGWDDYKGLDVRGKILVMLVNDPAVPNPRDPSKLDDKMFKGRAMTYYGRWTYKYEIAAQKGAAGIFIVHETGPAGYPWAVPKGSFSSENFDIVSKDKNMSRVNVEGWITTDAAKRLFRGAGQEFDDLKKAATRRDFKPVDLKAKAVLKIDQKLRYINSANVVGKLEGADPKLKDEYVIYTAHWDHFGIGEANEKGDKIYNGALDNATGCAALLELIQAFKALPAPPKRSILFLFVTAEERGLIGSKYYAENPLYPLEKTVANINIDGLNQWGRTKDFTVIGLGNSTLDDVLKQAAAEKGRYLKPDAEPEKGFYYRSDHFNFAKQGVPALDPSEGIEFVGKPADYGMKKREAYTANDYHKPSDEIKPDWDLSGAVEDVQLLFTVGYRVANTLKYPEWTPGNEFKAKRDAMLRRPPVRKMST
jgi:Zn-dependent M28 family amino/carboxypeptidase